MRRSHSQLRCLPHRIPTLRCLRLSIYMCKVSGCCAVWLLCWMQLMDIPQIVVLHNYLAYNDLRVANGGEYDDDEGSRGFFGTYIQDLHMHIGM